MTSTVPPPIILVHGLSHGAWCWEEHIAPWLRSRGREVVAIDMRGHGTRRGETLRFIPLAGYVDDVAEAVKALGRPPVLVGHSMGGGVVQRYLERGAPAVGAVLLASLPHYGLAGAALRFAKRHPLRFLAVNATLSFQPMVGTPAAFRDFFTPSTPEAVVAQAQAKGQDESYRAFLDMLLMGISRPPPSTVPTLVLAGSRDGLFSLRDERNLAAYHHAEFTIFEGMGHDLMLDTGWEAVAQRIDAFVETISADRTFPAGGLRKQH